MPTVKPTTPGDTRPDPRAGDQTGRLLVAAVRLVERALIAAGVPWRQQAELPDAAPPLITDKVRCEASMLLRAATPLAGRVPGLRAALGRLATCLAEDPGQLAVRLCLNPGIALDLALPSLHLRDLGLGDPRLEPLLGDLLGPDRQRGPERPPHRELEQLWLHGLWAGEFSSASMERAVAASCLAGGVDHLSGTTEDAYAFTHAVLYASDHGRRRVALPRTAADIVADADALLAVALDAGNHDVAAEVLWTWPMLALEWTPLASVAFDFQSQLSDSRGFLPGPGFDPAVWQGLSADARDEYLLRTSYHTTLVHGLLLASVLGGPGARRRELADQPAGPTFAADAIAALVPPTERAAAWWAYFAHQPRDRQELLAPALVTMALRRAVAAVDLPAVGEILRVAGERQLGDTPASRQARVLVRRALASAACV